MSVTKEIADKKMAYRLEAWKELRKVARPDSRYHWDFTRFIPDFEGSEVCAQLLAGIDAYAGLGDRRAFVTPDNCLDHVRSRLLRDAHPFVMTTFSLARGFLEVQPGSVPDGEYTYAGSIDGANRLGGHVSLEGLRTGSSFALVITGCSVVSRNGVRFGKGHGYFDVEWAILSELGKTDEATSVVAVCHDTQVIDDDLDPDPHDTIVDWIITPTRAIEVHHEPREPGRIRWDLLARAGKEGVPVLEELRQLVGSESSDE
jgi:5-formyltetrahydrofolate cyclo-ligase